MRLERLLALALLAMPALASAADAPPPPPPDDWSGAPPTAPSTDLAPLVPPADPGALADPGAPPPPPPPDGAPLPEHGAAAAGADGGITGTAPVDPNRHSPHTRDFAYDDVRNLRLASSVGGPVGLARLLSAEPGPKGTVRMGLTGEFFDAQGFPVQETQNQRTAGVLTLAFTPVEWVDLYGAYSLSSNRNSLGAPPLIQAQGDTWLGVKAGYMPAEPVWIGADLRLVFFPAIGDQKPNAVGFAPQLLGTFDVRKVEKSVPLRVHLNTGVRLDGTKNLSAETLSPAETYALGVNAYTRYTLGAGLEAPLPFVSPFFEYGVEIPVGAPATLLQPDGTLVTPAEASPMRFTVGLRVTALEDLSFLLASDIGLQRHVVEGVAATPPYNLLFGLAYTVDPLGKREQVVVERLVQAPVVPVLAATPSGKIVGTVLDATTRMPIAGAILAMNSSARAGLPPVATDASGGRFLSYDLPPGPVEVTASKEGYKPAVLPLTVEAGKDTPAEILLEKELPKGPNLKVTVRGPKGPIDASIAVEGAQPGTIAVKNGDGELLLPPGRYTLKVTADGHLSRETAVEIAAGAPTSIQFELSVKPKNTVLIIRKDKILTKRTIQFRSGSAEILPESYPILDEVLSAIVENNYKRLRVDGHTDNQGGKAKNQKLSEDRGASVRDYLVKGGLDQGRLDSTGFGDSKPLAPNLTGRGRAMNRRVEFTILEQ